MGLPHHFRLRNDFLNERLDFLGFFSPPEAVGSGFTNASDAAPAALEAPVAATFDATVAAAWDAAAMVAWAAAAFQGLCKVKQNIISQKCMYQVKTYASAVANKILQR